MVIGNPLEVHLEKIKDNSLALENANDQTYHSHGYIFCVFEEKGIYVLKPNKLNSYILPLSHNIIYIIRKNTNSN